MALKFDDVSDEKIVAEINVTPLIDIMLVLLIIFMVTSSVVLESGLDIDLPKTESKTTKKEGRAVLISLDKNGVLSVQGQKTSDDLLKSRIAKELKESSTDLIVFEGDQQSTLQRAIQIMDVAKAAGAKRFAIATEGIPSK